MKKTNTIQIDGDKFHQWCARKNIKQTDLSKELGYSDTYISNVMAVGRMTKTVITILELKYGLDPNEITRQPQITRETEPGYRLELTVKPDKVRVGIMFGEKEWVHAWSHVKGDSEVDLVQAISYATHMCYKIVQQQSLEAGN